MAKDDRISKVKVSLATSQIRFIEAEVAKRGYASISEYFRHLIGERQGREAARRAVCSILELQKELALRGVSVEELIDEGRDRCQPPSE